MHQSIYAILLVLILFIRLQVLNCQSETIDPLKQGLILDSSSVANSIPEDWLSHHPILLEHYENFPSKICGQQLWLHEFLDKRKKDINDGRTRSRLISVSDRGGANDRIAGILTQFYLSVLSNRDFSIASYPRILENSSYEFRVAVLEDVFDEHQIRWRVSKSDALDISYHIFNHTSNYDTKTLLYHNYLPLFTNINDTSMKKYNVDSKILKDIFNSSIRQIIIDFNRGSTYAMLSQNKFPVLSSSSSFLDPRFGAYCSFFRLFKPNSETLKLSYQSSVRLTRNITAADELLNVLTSSSLRYNSNLYNMESVVQYTKNASFSIRPIRIGIQIRTGDKVIIDGLNSEELKEMQQQEFESFFISYFRCARYLESLIRSSLNDLYYPILWFVMTDSIQLKRFVLRRFGRNKIVTDAIHKPQHLVGNFSFGLQLVLGEVLTLSLCDYFIISPLSGIGKLGVWLSKNRSLNNTFVNGRNANCQRISDAEMAYQPAGV